MKFRLIVGILTLYSLSLFAAGDTLFVLCIGNSFSIDAVEQELLPMAEKQGIPLRIGNLYIPGCSLETHALNARYKSPAYSYRELYGKMRMVRDSVCLQDALTEYPWAVITMQQASHDSGLWETYEPWLQELIDTVQAHCPNAQLAWHQTWAYAADATHPGFQNYHHSQEEMYAAIESCTDSVLQHYPSFLLIPTGRAVQIARKGRLGDTLCRDGFHLRFEYGRYLAACVWLEALTGERPHCQGNIRIPYYAYLKGYPDGVLSRSIRSSRTERLCRHAAHQALRK